MDQAFRLLRAQCANCHRFRLARVEINLFCCKLRLIRLGLLKEAEDIDDVQLKSLHRHNAGGGSVQDEMDAFDLSEDEEGGLIFQRQAFVKRAIRGAGRGSRQNVNAARQNEAMSEARKRIIRDFQASIVKTRRCNSCKM